MQKRVCTYLKMCMENTVFCIYVFDYTLDDI